jgi:1,2-diacylglycerol 3-alpha-glucosyltransferase
MRIAMFTNLYAPKVGGITRSIQAFREQLRQMGHHVAVIAPYFPGSQDEPDVLRVPSVTDFPAEGYAFPLPVPGALPFFLDRFDPDVIHSHHPFLLGDTALRSASTRNLPLVYSHHTRYESYAQSFLPYDPGVISSFAMELCVGYCNFADAVIAPSLGIANSLRSHGITSHVEVIPTGVDVERFSIGCGREVRRQLGIQPNDFVVGHVGRLSPEKNLPFLTDAMIAFLKTNPTAHFVVAGRGSAQPDVQDRFLQHQVDHRVHFLGTVAGQELVDVYHSFDAFAFTSLSETQGMVLSEAFAAGVPVVALEASGVCDAVEDMVNGRLVKSARIDDFHAALKELSECTPAQKNGFSESAKATAKRLSLTSTADKLETLYEKAIQTRRSRRTIGQQFPVLVRRLGAEWKVWLNLLQAASEALLNPLDEDVISSKDEFNATPI